MKFFRSRAFLFVTAFLALSCAKAQVLQEFSEKLNALRNDRSESLQLAMTDYKERFAQSDPQTADSAYVLLEDFAVLLTKNIDFNLILLRAGNKDRDKREKSPSAEYVDLLHSHYFSTIRRNGLITLRPDLARIQTELKDFLSARTYAYFQAVRQDTNSAGETAILEFSPAELAQRACFWEGFLRDTTPFLYREEAMNRCEAYIEQLVFGSEKQPLFENGLLKDNYKEAYKQILHDCLNGKTKTVIGDYMKLLKENDYRDCPAVWMFRY